MVSILMTMKIWDAEEIRLAPTPGKSKRLGRHCVIRKDWGRY